MIIRLFLFLSIFVCFSANASAPVCSASHGGYCHYSGTVTNLYVNSGGLILMYFDTAMPSGEPSKAGISLNYYTAGSVKISDNPDFAKLFYSTALTALSTGKKVSVQMRGNEGGYPNIDRIWLEQ
ncbi:hypothetical protein ZX61_08570 [Vibrio sp. VPAP30]|nr:hypothetical protein ZX61_08570 [Vibrio sp. VPAP30]